MSRIVSIFPDRPEIDQIWDYYEFVRSLLDVAYRSALRGEPFIGVQFSDSMQGQSIAEAFQVLINELEDEVTLALSSAFEAFLRVDFLQRVDERRKDDVSRAFRDVYKDKEKRFRLDDVLDVWRDVGGIRKSCVSAVKQLVDFRNWLAHGRYWSFLSRKYDPAEALAVTESFFEELESY